MNDSALFGGEGPDSDWARTMAVQDPATGLRALLVIHSLARGPAFGGIRRYAYADEAAGFADARALAHAMSLKCALAGLDAGGGKTIIFDHAGLAREAAYAALGRAIESLAGSYVCGPDVGTGPAELAALRTSTRWVNPVRNDASRSTALGVLAGLRGLSSVCFGSASLGARRYVIQGLGGVGSALAEALIAAGGEVAGWDPSPQAQARARALGVELLAEDTLWRTRCDVFMPCALGRVLTVERCAQGPWRAVCGSANNQLASHAAAQCLRERGIDWAPDFVVNAGAVIEGVVSVGAGVLAPRAVEAAWERAAATTAQEIAEIEPRCATLLEQARRAGLCPSEVALAAANERLCGQD